MFMIRNCKWSHLADVGASAPIVGHNGVALARRSIVSYRTIPPLLGLWATEVFKFPLESHNSSAEA